LAEHGAPAGTGLHARQLEARREQPSEGTTKLGWSLEASGEQQPRLPQQRLAEPPPQQGHGGAEGTLSIHTQPAELAEVTLVPTPESALLLPATLVRPRNQESLQSARLGHWSLRCAISFLQ